MLFFFVFFFFQAEDGIRDYKVTGVQTCALPISGAAEVLGDYGAGPNHVLPTGGTARSTGGLSVYTFLRVRTWLRIDDPAAARPLLEDAVWFGRAEGLEAHARAAERRLLEEPDGMARPARGFPTP